MSRFDDLSPRDRELAHSLHAGLRERHGEPDAVASARLRAARARAVEASQRPQFAGWLYASGGLVAAAAVAVLLVLRPAHQAGTASTAFDRPSQAEALDVLTDDVDAEFYEDLDLYRWLDREHDGAA